MSTTTLPSELTTPDQERPRRRVVLWVALTTAAVLAALVAVLATSGPATQVSSGSPLIGQAAPAVSGPDQSGHRVTLSADRGRWVIVNFAASWCTPCQRETPQLLAFAARHAASGGPTIVTVEEDERDLASLRRFLAIRHATWPVVDDATASPLWGIGQLPQSYLVDPSGTVMALVSGGVNADALDRLISSLSPTAQ